MRAIVANLDCELRWSQAHSQGPHKELPPAVRRAVSSLSQDMRIFGTPEDTFVSLADMASSPAQTLGQFSEILVWGQTPQHSGKAAPRDDDAPWQERLWQLTCSPEIAAKVNDRRFCLNLPLPRQGELDAVRTVASLEELDSYVEGEALGPDESWVAKAPWSASGRERLKRRGRALESEQRAFAQRLLRRYGALVVEPWMRRTADFGVAGLVGETLESSLLFPAHQLLCDASGVFRGIRIDDEQTRSMLGPHGDALGEGAQIVTEALHAHGYRGPFGVDAFLYNDGGTTRLRAVCEINARISFGHVARAITEAAEHLTGEFTPRC